MAVGGLFEKYGELVSKLACLHLGETESDVGQLPITRGVIDAHWFILTVSGCDEQHPGRHAQVVRNDAQVVRNVSRTPAWQAIGVSGSWEPVDPARSLNDWEKRVLTRLAPDASREAVDAVRVVERCTCGCSSVGLSSAEAAFPVAEGEATDADGMTIWVMLFADGDQQTLVTLDVLRPDGGAIQELPKPETISVSKTSTWMG